MLDRELTQKLKAKFPPEDHKQRDLPGGGKWFFIPWQRIRERLDEICPGWQCEFSDPVVAGELMVVRCKLTIEGVTREGVGNSDAFKEKTKANTYKFGSPIECAIADSFKNAAEMFGVGAYIDDQRELAKYLHENHDYRAKNLMIENSKFDNTPNKAKGEISREEWLKLKEKN